MEYFMEINYENEKNKNFCVHNYPTDDCDYEKNRNSNDKYMFNNYSSNSDCEKIEKDSSKDLFENETMENCLHRRYIKNPVNDTKKETISIEKRNARERCRVRAVNEAFVRLRRAIPSIAARQKRVSKVKTLQKALQYIMELEFLLNSYC